MRSDGVRVYHTKQRNTGERGESGRPQLVNNGPRSVNGITTNKCEKCVWYNLKSPNLLPRKKGVCQYVNDA